MSFSHDALRNDGHAVLISSPYNLDESSRTLEYLFSGRAGSCTVLVASDPQQCYLAKLGSATLGSSTESL